MHGKGKIIAMDLYDDRLAMLKENLRRMNLESVQAVHGDASREEDVRRASGNSAFDRIMLDVPCTNTGVLRRRPDARWRFTLKRLVRIADIQRAILDNVSRFLKPGGTLVYSTCSLEREECGDVTESWLAAGSGFELGRSVKLFPPESQTDGVYAVALHRVNPLPFGVTAGGNEVTSKGALSQDPTS